MPMIHLPATNATQALNQSSCTRAVKISILAAHVYGILECSFDEQVFSTSRSGTDTPQTAALFGVAISCVPVSIRRDIAQTQEGLPWCEVIAMCSDIGMLDSTCGKQCPFSGLPVPSIAAAALQLCGLAQCGQQGLHSCLQ